MKVLLVEDEILIQKSLKMLMEKRGAEVVAVSSGKDAILEIKQQEFDRIVCDLMLTDISGFDVIEESKSKLSTEEISSKFIIITAYSSSQVIEKANNYGCKVLNKPFENINEVIEIFLTNERT
ncbi:MAG: hypothetical protein CME65_09620 [Halobacteriovoraceae bacterium]|nr:hypothetical protein [Halobacteriovoraceae bacterium]|tara:strand:- start:6332 stop:6700 length:369 start_codon:yes stop_codon:yes gene_type:complete